MIGSSFSMTLWIGVAGATILLAFFILNHFKFLANGSMWYDGGNLIGAALLAWYAHLIGSMPFLIIESVWALVSLRGLVHHWNK